MPKQRRAAAGPAVALATALATGLAIALVAAGGGCRDRSGSAPTPAPEPKATTAAAAATATHSAASEAAPAPATLTVTPRWAGESQRRLSRVEVAMCFHGSPAARLDAQTPLTRAALSLAGDVPDGVTLDDDGIDLRGLSGLSEHSGVSEHSGLSAGAKRDGEPDDRVPCVHYQIDLDVILDLGDDGQQRRMRLRGYRYGDDVLLSPDYWLLRPRGDALALQAEFVLTPGMQSLVPWPLVAGGRHPRGPYEIPATSFTWRIHGAVGSFAIDSFAVADATVRVAMLGDRWQVERAQILGWLAQAAEAVATLYEGFPVPSAQILLVPTAGGKVVFGNTAQGGGDSVALVVGVEVDEAGLRDDWVAVHELLHLGMPMVDNDSRWLSEGLATYYEPLLRARAGIITPRQAWEQLYDGFTRGRTQVSARSLRQESREMGETHHYWRVYWGGAAIALIADVAMRQHDPPAPSLDQQVRAMRRCCLDQEAVWSAEALLGRAAEATGSPDALSLATIAGRYVDSAAFPALADTYEALGLTFDERGRLTGAADAPAAIALRAAIMGRDVELAAQPSPEPGAPGSPAKSLPSGPTQSLPAKPGPAASSRPSAATRADR